MVLSPGISGGGGFTFEDVPVAIYLGALLSEETAPGLEDRVVTRVAMQQAQFGEPLDDLIVDGTARDDSTARLSLQVKRELTISSAASNTDFREIVTRAWTTLAKGDFREDTDRVGAIAGTVAEGPRRALNDVCEWARGSLSVETFLARFQPGTAGDQHRGVLGTFRAILPPLPDGAPDDAAVLRLLRHFVLITIDALHAGATDVVNAIERLRGHLHDPSQAEDLWNRLRVIAREAAGRAVEFNRPTLLAALHGRFRFQGARLLRSDLGRIDEETRNALATIGHQIDGIDIARPSVLASAEAALTSHRFVHIIGFPGTGKSAVLRSCVEREWQKGTVLLLKSDRLSGRNWAAHAQSLGLSAVGLEALLVEIAAAGSSVLFIDGIDRIEVPNRGIVLDLLGTILQSPVLADWKIIATSRDNGIEPLRTWLPAAFFDGTGVGSVEVGPFNDEESEALAERKPALRRLLFGNERVRDIARRPFFAAVLARAVASDAEEAVAPTSEVELIDVWWSRGGYDSDAARIYHRQRALIALAKAGAPALGRRMGLDGIDLDSLRELKEDDIVRDVRAGHTVQFTHDIFFEWSFLHLLIEREAAWIDEIRALGEPPVLGRTIELLSQAVYSDFGNWAASLRQLETATVRPQWRRAWLLAPFGSPRFWGHADEFSAAMLRNDAKHLAQLAVWFQAEKTQANPLVLGRNILPQALTRGEIVRYADALAWPSDVGTWNRFLRWVLRIIESCPVTILADIVSAFEVWQNMLADRANPVSAAIIANVSAWLEDIEDREHSEEVRFDYGRWRQLSSGERDELEERLRNILLRSARVEVERVRGYLRRLQDREHLRDAVFGKVIGWAPTLAINQARELVDLCLAALIDDLPADVAARDDDARLYSRSFSLNDWHELAIRDSGGAFFPASPLREPFPSLFRSAPREAQELVRAITNHTITAWRQLHDLMRREQGTPIPLVLDFPWGRQEFWGDGRVYLWSRGQWAPPPVVCGLMALEAWAFGEVERGRAVDEVIEEVVSGPQSCAVLNIALALALESNRVSPVTLPLATSQRIWHWDIGRLVGDGSGAVNLIGFMRPSDLSHAQAVRAANERPARRLEVRGLAQLFVLSANGGLRVAAQRAIQSFPNDLPYEVEEEREHPERTAHLRRTAEIWAEVGRIENYSATPAPDGSGTLIALENPRSSDPDIVATAQRSARMNEQLTVLNWVHDSFEHRTVSQRLPLEEALRRAHQLGRNDLFQSAHGEDHTVDRDQGLVTGVAAVALLYAETLDVAEAQWSKDVLLRASATPEHYGELWSSRSMPLFHPCLYAAQGLPVLIRRGLDAARAEAALIGLAGHPLEAVSETALRGALSVWDVDPNFAWIALNLAIRLSVGSRDRIVSPYGYDHATARDRMAVTVDVALREVGSGETITALQPIPPPWVHAPPRPRNGGLRFRIETTEPIWREPDEFLRCDFLPKIFPGFPVDAALNDALRRPAFLAFCYGLLDWTLERMKPSWRAETPRGRSERNGTELIEWRQTLMNFLARVALLLDADEVQRRMLDRIFALDDDEAESLIHPFVDVVTAAGIFDAPQIAPNAVRLVMACLERTLRDHAWAHARYDEGDLYGYDVPPLVRLYLFVSIEYAGGAARFANRDWREVDAILPIVDRFVREVGDVPDVMSSFLTLCERAVEHYPVAAFIAQVTAAMNRQERTPVGWRNSTLPGHIAGLIHAFAEREQPLERELAQGMLRVLDRLVDMGDRRSAALQTSETFKNVRL